MVDVSALSLLISLSQVRLDNAGLTNLAPVQFLFNLKSLDLANNSISDISPLLGLSNLTTLKLRQNLIITPAPLASSIGLISLDLSFNPAPAWNFVSKLTNLTELALQGNGLADVDFLRPLRGENRLEPFGAEHIALFVFRFDEAVRVKKQQIPGCERDARFGVAVSSV